MKDDGKIHISGKKIAPNEQGRSPDLAGSNGDTGRYCERE